MGENEKDYRISWSIRELIRQQAEWSNKNFGNQPSYRPLLGVVEEAGELCHAHLKGEQGIRLTPEQVKEKKVDAVGDILIYLIDCCNREGIDMVDDLFDTWEGIVHKRDWTADPVSATAVAKAPQEIKAFVHQIISPESIVSPDDLGA